MSGRESRDTLSIAFTYSKANELNTAHVTVRAIEGGVVEVLRERGMYPFFEITYTPAASKDRRSRVVDGGGPIRRIILWEVVQEEGRKIDKCARCPHIHMLGFRRKHPPEPEFTQYGVPVEGFVRYEDLANPDSATARVVAQLRHFAKTCVPGDDRDSSDNTGLYARQLQAKTFPVVAYSSLLDEDKRTFRALLGCNSHFHKNQCFFIRLQAVSFQNDKVVNVVDVQSAPLRVVSKFLEKASKRRRHEGKLILQPAEPDEEGESDAEEFVPPAKRQRTREQTEDDMESDGRERRDGRRTSFDESFPTAHPVDPYAASYAPAAAYPCQCEADSKLKNGSCAVPASTLRISHLAPGSAPAAPRDDGRRPTPPTDHMKAMLDRDVEIATLRAQLDYSHRQLELLAHDNESLRALLSVALASSPPMNALAALRAPPPPPPPTATLWRPPSPRTAWSMRGLAGTMGVPPGLASLAAGGATLWPAMAPGVALGAAMGPGQRTATTTTVTTGSPGVTNTVPSALPVTISQAMSASQHALSPPLATYAGEAPLPRSLPPLPHPSVLEGLRGMFPQPPMDSRPGKHHRRDRQQRGSAPPSGTPTDSGVAALSTYSRSPPDRAARDRDNATAVAVLYDAASALGAHRAHPHVKVEDVNTGTETLPSSQR